MILAFYGAGAMGREFKYVADETGQWTEMVFIDDHAAADSPAAYIFRSSQSRAAATASSR